MLAVMCAAVSLTMACGRGGLGPSSSFDSGSDDALGDRGGVPDAAIEDATGAFDSTLDAVGSDAGDATIDSSGASTPCYANDDCVGGACDYWASVCTGNVCTATFVCPGKCVPFAGDGGGCTAGPSGPICDPDSGLVCLPCISGGLYCAPPSQLIPPVVDAAGDPCGLCGADCSSGLFCYAPVFPDDGICLPVSGDGGACDPLNPGCAAGLVCAGFGSYGLGSSLDAGVCRPPSTAGGGCITGDAGEYGNPGCVPHTLCIDGGCIALPSTGTCLEGQCDPNAAYCDSTTNTCVPFVPNGVACDASTQCASRLCASNANTCVASLPIGAECAGPYDCSKGICGNYLGCASGICDVTNHCAATMCPRDAGP
jgi:hypothetical protein